MNHAAIDRGINGFSKVTVPAAWKTATDEAVVKEAVAETPVLKEYEGKILAPVNAQRGDKLPVSTFVDSADGTVPLGSAALENAVSPSMFLSGFPKIVFSVTSAPMSVPTP